MQNFNQQPFVSYSMTKQRKPSYLNFDIDSYPWKPDIDYRRNPEAYRVGKGEQGVLICEPYKTEIGKHWRFKTPDIATQSSETIYKFLQMGYTRARRYANYKGGKKYDKKNDYAPLERGTGDAEKAEAAAIFFQKWKKAEASPIYAKLKADWKKQFG